MLLLVQRGPYQMCVQDVEVQISGQIPNLVVSHTDTHPLAIPSTHVVGFGPMWTSETKNGSQLTFRNSTENCNLKMKIKINLVHG